jgi:hypothetical protein
MLQLEFPLLNFSVLFRITPCGGECRLVTYWRPGVGICNYINELSGTITSYLLVCRIEYTKCSGKALDRGVTVSLVARFRLLVGESLITSSGILVSALRFSPPRLISCSILLSSTLNIITLFGGLLLGRHENGSALWNRSRAWFGGVE